MRDGKLKWRLFSIKEADTDNRRQIKQKKKAQSIESFLKQILKTKMIGCDSLA